MRSRRILLAVFASLALAALAVTAVPATGEGADSGQKGRSNIMVKITLGKIEDGNRKPLRTYQMLVPGSGNSPARFSTTNRIPIPAIAVSQDTDGHPIPTSSYTYQNVGFQANIRAWALDDDTVRLSGDIDDSALYNPSDIDRGPMAPVMTGFNQSIDAVVREGTPLVSTLVEDPKGQSLYIQLSAEVLR